MRFAWSIPVAVLCLLAGCSSLSQPAPNAARPLDFLGDDMASVVLAFDLPDALEPLGGGPLLSFDIVATGGSRHVEAALVPADAEDVAAGLPPPSSGRRYYLFAFAEGDKEKVRNAVAWAKALPPGSLTPQSVSIGVSPRLCADGPLDASRLRFSVLAALPGVAAVSTLVPTGPVAPPGAALPPCPGHSG